MERRYVDVPVSEASPTLHASATAPPREVWCGWPTLARSVQTHPAQLLANRSRFDCVQGRYVVNRFSGCGFIRLTGAPHARPACL